jgi:hypothetical protein
MDELRISNHFIERFNLRYFGRDEKWKIGDLKGYLSKVLKPYQLKHLMRRKDFDSPQYIHFGSKHSLVVMNNTIVTIYNTGVK